MTDDPIEFPVDDDARQRLSRRRRRWRRIIGNGVVQPKAFSNEVHERIRQDEKRRTMPETLMLLVIWTVGVLTVVPVLLLAVVGY